MVIALELNIPWLNPALSWFFSRLVSAYVNKILKRDFPELASELHGSFVEFVDYVLSLSHKQNCFDSLFEERKEMSWECTVTRPTVWSLMSDYYDQLFIVKLWILKTNKIVLKLKMKYFNSVLEGKVMKYVQLS